MFGIACSAAALVTQLSVPATLQLSALVLAVSLLGAMIVSWRRDRGVGGAAFIYTLVFGLFHGGLVFAVALGGESMIIGQGNNDWVLSSEVHSAVTAVCVAVIAWELGLLASLPSRRAPQSGAARTSRSRTDLVGYAGVLLGLGLITLALQPGGGIGVLFSGYLVFLEKVANDGIFGYGIVMLGYGVGFLVASGGRARLIGWAVMAAIALVGLPLGLRGTVLFLLATVLVVEAKRTRIRSGLFALAALLVLALVSVLRTTRTGGLSALLDDGLARATPLEAAAEMGYSLYPVVVVQHWLDSGVEVRGGVTFVAPIVRFAEGLLGMDTVPGASDLRIFNVEMLTLQGPIGGSPVAEGLRNGGILGVCLLMGLLGWVIGRVDRLPATADGGALTAVVFLPLIIAVRNSFAPVLVQLAIGFIMLFVARMIGRNHPRGEP
ncbi:O-antigen polysaccharide polymerase Wzy [Agromyces sp. NPDC056389]